MKTKIVAEFASSWNQSLELAKAMVRACKDVQVDVIKTQAWKAEYVKDTDPDKKRYEALEMSDEVHAELKKYTEELGMSYMTTITRKERIPFFKELGLKKAKVASVQLSDFSLLQALVENFDEVIASTAMQDQATIMGAASILRDTDTLMHCVANYPLEFKDANLKKIEWLKHFRQNIGFSDHTLGVHAAIVAMSIGINYYEKHFSLSQYLPQTKHQMFEGGPMITTHEVANEPHVFKEIAKLRDDIDLIRGDGHLAPNSIELQIADRYRNRY